MREDHAAPRAAGAILRARAHGGSAQSLGIACEGACRIHVHREVNEVGGAPFATDAERLRAAPMRTGAQDSPGSPERGVVFPHAIAPKASTTAARAAVVLALGAMA